MPTTATITQPSEGELPVGADRAGDESPASQPDAANVQAAPAVARYQRLAELAASYSAAALEHRQQCHDEAHQLLAAAKDYFQAPDDAIRLISLDAQLEPLDPQPHQQLRLIPGRDAYWYFGLQLQFGTGRDLQANLTVGLKFTSDALVARLRTDSRISPTKSNRWTRVLQTLEAGLLEHFQRPPSDPRKPLGYTLQ